MALHSSVITAEKKMTIQFYGSLLLFATHAQIRIKSPTILLYVDPLSLCRVALSHDPWWPNSEGNSDAQCLALE